MSFKVLANLARCAADLGVASPEATSDFDSLAVIFASLDAQKPKTGLALLKNALLKSPSSPSETTAADHLAALISIAEAAESKAAVVNLLRQTESLFPTDRQVDLAVTRQELEHEMFAAQKEKAEKSATQREKREKSAQRVRDVAERFRSVETTREALTQVFNQTIAERPPLSATEWKSLAKQLTGNNVGSKREAEEEIAAWIRSRSHWEISHRSVEKALAEGY